MKTVRKTFSPSQRMNLEMGMKKTFQFEAYSFPPQFEIYNPEATVCPSEPLWLTINNTGFVLPGRLLDVQGSL